MFEKVGGLVPQTNSKNKKRSMRKNIPNNTRSKLLKGICPCCGKNEKRIIHHILPLSLGGLDDECNMVGVCEECHNKIHGGISKHELSVKGQTVTGNLGGRPKKIDDSFAFPLLDKFAMFQISKEELCGRLGISPNAFLSENKWFGRWKNDRCIPKNARIGMSQVYVRGNEKPKRMINGKPMVIENGKFVGYKELDEKTIIEYGLAI